jgi:hypothetical protein
MRDGVVSQNFPEAEYHPFGEIYGANKYSDFIILLDLLFALVQCGDTYYHPAKVNYESHHKWSPQKL